MIPLYQDQDEKGKGRLKFERSEKFADQRSTNGQQRSNRRCGKLTWLLYTNGKPTRICFPEPLRAQSKQE